VSFSFYEFFAGGGMARAGLGPGWSCGFANDFDPMKARTYAENWGGDELRCADVASIAPGELPGRPDLVWAPSLVRICRSPATAAALAVSTPTLTPAPAPSGRFGV
jgi:hypothetical protein